MWRGEPDAQSKGQADGERIRGGGDRGFPEVVCNRKLRDVQYIQRGNRLYVHVHGRKGVGNSQDRVRGDRSLWKKRGKCAHGGT